MHVFWQQTHTCLATKEAAANLHCTRPATLQECKCLLLACTAWGVTLTLTLMISACFWRADAFLLDTTCCNTLCRSAMPDPSSSLHTMSVPKCSVSLCVTVYIWLFLCVDVAGASNHPFACRCCLTGKAPNCRSGSTYTACVKTCRLQSFQFVTLGTHPACSDSCVLQCTSMQVRIKQAVMS